MSDKIIRAISSRIRSFIYKLGYGNNFKGMNLFWRISNLTINGTGNTIVINCRLSKGLRIMIFGNNHKLTIDKNVTFKRGTIWFEDNACEIHISSNTTIESANISVAEDSTRCVIGNDCMLSQDIRISTTDSHSVIDNETGLRLNNAADIIIEPHVWIGYAAAINKGVIIGHDSVVAGHSVVTKSVEPHTVVAGVPAKPVKGNINWDRKRI